MTKTYGSGGRTVENAAGNVVTNKDTLQAWLAQRLPGTYAAEAGRDVAAGAAMFEELSAAADKDVPYEVTVNVEDGGADGGQFRYGRPTDAAEMLQSLDDRGAEPDTMLRVYDLDTYAVRYKASYDQAEAGDVSIPGGLSKRPIFHDDESDADSIALSGNAFTVRLSIGAVRDCDTVDAALDAYRKA